ncbi:Ino eighty subunit 1 [Wickerhamomyces ciferrii]|uniref:Ino eighty subunit 1 n=1 Tax=Wickerhamomyces ciferrii (strain ATCC 14091 / BCRC 22168 / CBS 111 / JCM 3599 / NBRC 0793 / NRRL Y-1031 F-60-10) TaxID=1206466 RepID=K0KIK9_WICCF|nr:Ino eighty subunit 1 [Wickerhamomyces ciferrii]CCH45055.1 Ino eighty subunit 1 [Wickerhamomyces ciferrii]
MSQNSQGSSDHIQNRFRHFIRRPENTPLSRGDIQFEFLKHLFTDENRIFTDPFPKSKFQIPKASKDHKLTFGEFYRKTLAHHLGPKKSMSQKLIDDTHESRSYAILFFLLNINCLSGIITFFHASNAAQRTFHTIPCLQVYGKHKADVIIFPELNAMRTLLNITTKANKEWYSMNNVESHKKMPVGSISNFLMSLLGSEDHLNNVYFKKENYKLYDIFKNKSFDPKSRVKLFLWITYRYIETDSKEHNKETNPFGPLPPKLRKAEYTYDIDTPEELKFGEDSMKARLEYLKDMGYGTVKKPKSSVKKSTVGTSPKRPPGRPPKNSPGRPRKVRYIIDDDDDEEEEIEEESDVSDDSGDGFEEWDEDQIEEDEDDEEDDEDDEDEYHEDQYEEKDKERDGAGAGDGDDDNPTEEEPMGVEGTEEVEAPKKPKKPIHVIARAKIKRTDKSHSKYKVIKKIPIEEDNDTQKPKRRKIEVQVQPRVPVKQLRKLPNPKYPLVDPSTAINESLSNLYKGFVELYGENPIGV